MGWIGFPDHFDDCGFGGAIDLRDVVTLLFDIDFELANIKAGTIDNLPGTTRGLEGNIQDGMHGRSGCRAGLARVCAIRPA